MKAEIKDKSILFKNKEVRVDDLYDESFYALSDAEAGKYYNDTYGVNELYNNLIQDYIAIKKWVNENVPNRLVVSEADKFFEFFIADIGEKSHIYVEGLGCVTKFATWLIYHASILSSTLYFAYILFKIPYKPGITVADKFAVVRTKASIKKFKKFTEISQEVESFYEKDSIYRLFPKWMRFGWAFKAYKNSWKTFHIMNAFYTPLLGKHFKYAMMDFYRKRIVYAELYKLMMDEYLSHFQGKEFYSGNNLDRYSVIEDQLCKKYQIKSYNIPHGIEYGFKYPKGFSSDVFYVHSQYTSDYLNNLYHTSKFVYDDSIIRRMFEYHYDKPHDKMIIFFTEPREVNVNVDIVNGLLPKLKEKGLKLYLKLHPGDNKANYEGMEVDFVTDYELSLTGNICISRKSTILLEAIYNNSLPVAIITNPKDQTTFNLFPSLNAKEIVKTYNVDDLYDVILNEVNSGKDSV